jgi:hypothetical protein
MSRATDAASLKAFACAWLRFSRSYDIVCTEDPIRNSDALGVDSKEDSKRMTEIEVKVDMGDLKADAEKYTGWGSGPFAGMKKHEAMLLKDEGEFTKNPSQFYFMVPKDMLEAALPYITSTHPHAGIISADPKEANWEKALLIIKRAPTLHKKKIDEEIKRRAQMRATSELCNLLLKRHMADLDKTLYDTIKSNQP